MKWESWCGDNTALHCIWSIASVNNPWATPSHYALLMSNLWFILVSFVRSQNLRQRRCIDFISRLILIRLLIILMWGQQGCLSHRLHVYHARDNKQKVCDEAAFCELICIRVVCVWVCAGCMCLFVATHALQWAAATIKEPIWKAALLHAPSLGYIFTCSGLIIYQADSCTSAADDWSSSQRTTQKVIKTCDFKTKAELCDLPTCDSVARNPAGNV